MRKGLLLLILFLLATILSAQNIMKVWSNDTLIEFDISTIDSITFEVKTEYVGVFSVANNKRVAFAPGNLQYIPTADTWLFAANQYDYIGTRNMVNQAFADTIDLFAWSTDTDPSTAWGVTLEDDNNLYAGNFVDGALLLVMAIHGVHLRLQSGNICVLSVLMLPNSLELVQSMAYMD